MPAAIPAIAAAAGAFATGTTVFGLSAVASAFVIGAGSFAVSALQAKLTPKPSASIGASLAGGITQQVRQAITTHKIVVGEARCSGPIVFFAATSTNKFLHFVIVLAAHEVKEIGELWLNDVSIPPDYIDATGLVTQGQYANLVRVKKYLGTDDQTADADLMGQVPSWTANCRLRGRAYIYVRYEYNADKFPTGVPNLSAWVKGRKVFDTRSAGTTWSPNAALIVNDYLTNERFGVGASAVDEDYTSAAANTCEEIVETQNVDATVAAIDVTSDIISLNGTSLFLQTADRVQLLTDGVLPGGLATLTDYYAIVYQRKGTPRIKLANSLANAIAGSAIDFNAGNLILQSQTFDNASWVKTRATVTADTTTAPDATSTADKLVEDGSTNTHFISQNYSFVSGREYTFSCHIKAAGRDYARIELPSAAFGAAQSVSINLTTGATLVNSGSATVVVENKGSGWYRISIYKTATAGASGNCNIYIESALGTNSYAGGSTHGIYLWGAQLETARVAQVYTATTTAAVTYSGNHTVRKTGEPRYFAGGVIDTQPEVGANLKQLLSAMGGKAIHLGGNWKLLAAAYRTPTVTLDESNLRGPIKVVTKVSRADRFNTVKGVYANPFMDAQPTDYPSYTNSSYKAADGKELNADLHLPYTPRAHTAQRLAKIKVEQGRQEQFVEYPCNLSALKIACGDVVNINNTRMGWSGKVFEVRSWKIVVEAGNGAQVIGIDLTLQETASGVYDWNAGEETSVDLAPNTDIPNFLTVSAPTGLAFDSFPVETLEGDVIFRIVLRWDEHPDTFVLQGGQMEIQYKLSSDVNYRPSFLVPGDQTASEIVQGSVNVAYDIRIRAINNLGVKSEWNSITGVIAGSSGGVTSSENWGAYVSDPVGTTEDWGAYTSDPVGTTDDWGTFI